MVQEGISRITALQEANKAVRADRMQAARAIASEAASESLQEWGDLAAFNPLALTKRFQTLEERIGRKPRGDQTGKAEKEDEEETKILQVETIDASAESYERKNPELSKHTLLLLRSKIKPEDSKEEILKKVLDLFSDRYLADDALDFLSKTTGGDLKTRVLSAKEELNTLAGREIRAGRNMGGVAQKYAKEGLGDPKTLRDLYREVTGNPKEPAVLFEEFASHFDFERLQPVIQFLLHSLGSDLKSKGPSISRAELQRLFSEARTLQSILGVYRFFRGRMGLIQSTFNSQGLLLPKALNFEILSKVYVKFLKESYPNTAKLFNLASILGIEEEEAAQLILFYQMKEGLRHTSPKLFRSEKHRSDLQSIFLDALEEIEESIEEEEEEEEEGQQKKRER